MSDPVAADQEAIDRIAAFGHWFHRIEVRPGVVTPGIYDSAALLAELHGLPQDCRGLRVLDVGTRDGYFAFEAERRGAEVVAVDYLQPEDTGFGIARDLLGAAVECEVCNVYDLDPARHGTFDVVLCLGLLYHLRTPLRALDRIWDVCRPGALLVVETQLLDHALLVDGTMRSLADIDPILADIALAQFYPGDALNGDPTNYWAPNAACMRGLLEDAGFAVRDEHVAGPRGIFHARQIDDPGKAHFRRIEQSTRSRGRGAPTPVPASAPRRRSALRRLLKR